MYADLFFMCPNRVLLRWCFTGIGLALWLLPGTILHKMLNAYGWAADLYPDDPLGQARFMLAVTVCLLVVGGLCQAAAWGFKRQRSWARGAGIAACVGLLPGFPWLTLIGAIGLIAVVSLPNDERTIKEDTSRLRHRETFLDWIVGVLTGVLLILGLGLLFRYAHSLGLPSIPTRGSFWVMLTVGELLVITVHEFGHALAAWAVHFRFKVINIGPLTVWKDATGHRHTRFEWKRLCAGGGYMGAVPTSNKSLRLNQILVVFAGPFVSLNAGLVLFLLFLNLAGTAGERYWVPVGLLSVLFAVDFIRNLIPIGYTDGTLLLHLTLDTRKGREFSATWFASKDNEEADKLQAHVDYESEVELRSRVLEQALAHGDSQSAELASKYQALGFAQLRARRSQEAGQNLTKSLDILKQCGGHPVAEGNSWMGLYSAYYAQQRPVEAKRAYTSAIAAFDKCKQMLPVAAVVDIRKAVAQMHLDMHVYESALEEIDQALLNFPSGRTQLLLKATLFRQRAECEFSLGCPKAALPAASTAAEILRSVEIAESDLDQAASDLGAVGVTLWMGGLNDRAVELLREAIRRTEERGVANRAARLRVTLAEVLRKAGRLEEAAAALPSADGLLADVHESFVAQRAQIHLLSRRLHEAIADLEEALRLKKADAHATTAEVATAEASLAEGYLDAGRAAEAELSARRACEVLCTTEHPNGAGALVTLAILARQQQQDSAGAYVDEALRLVTDAKLLKTASKARFLEAAADRLERFGWMHKAKEFRAAAATRWQTLGRNIDSVEQPTALAS